ncbi:MAG TPA: nitrate/nitrite transporter NrtS [Nodularia sp. (in: cyanobacteria)]|nr:nitrate/nitrite transporter NrtS [Nodularia sp. (in: cyanobacteria)]
MSTAVKVALMFGSISFMINHGSYLCPGKMSHELCISAKIIYLVLYAFNLHTQYVIVYRLTQAKKVQ